VESVEPWKQKENAIPCLTRTALRAAKLTDTGGKKGLRWGEGGKETHPKQDYPPSWGTRDSKKGKKKAKKPSKN